MRNLLSHPDGDTGEEPPFQHFDCIVLQRAERAHEQQGNHDAGQRDDRHGLDGKGEGVRQFLNGQRNDQRKQADRQRVGHHEASRRRSSRNSTPTYPTTD